MNTPTVWVDNISDNICFLENLSKTIVENALEEINKKDYKIYYNYFFGKPAYMLKSYTNHLGEKCLSFDNKINYYTEKRVLNKEHRNYITIFKEGFTIGNFSKIPKKYHYPNGEDNSGFFSLYYANTSINNKLENFLSRSVKELLNSEEFQKLKNLLTDWRVFKEESVLKTFINDSNEQYLSQGKYRELKYEFEITGAFVLSLFEYCKDRLTCRANDELAIISIGKNYVYCDIAWDENYVPEGPY